MNQDADVKAMTPGELRQEVMRLRRGIVRWVTRYDNQRCHEEDKRLAALVGMVFRCSNHRKASDFLGDCRQFALRECRAGRLVNDLTNIAKD